MTIKEAAAILDAEVLTCEDRLDQEIRTLCGSDMMSEVLAFTQEGTFLLTGLCNPQVMRTAEMMDLMCVVFVRGKKPTEEMLEMAREEGLVILATRTGMYNACGKLFVAGAGSGCI